MSKPTLPPDIISKLPPGFGASQLVKYGDTFYIYAYTGGNAGWVYQTNQSTNYLAVSRTFSPATSTIFTILPSEDTQVTTGSKGAPSNQPNQFTLSSNNINMLGKPVQTTDVFYLGLTTVIGDPDWYNSKSFASVTGGKDQVWLTDINNYPYNGQIKATNIVVPPDMSSLPYLAYSITKFNLDVPFNYIGYCLPLDKLNNPTGPTTRNTPWTVNSKYTYNSDPEIMPNFAVTCSNAPLPAFFVFVPAYSYHCTNYTCQPYPMQDYFPGNIVYSSTTCDNVCQPLAKYACVDGVCQPSPTGSLDPTCGGGCPSASYTCTGGQCIASSTGTLSLHDCSTICGSYTCAAGVCLAVTSGSTAGSFASSDACSSACREGGTRWWLWGLAGLVLLLFLGGVIIAVVVLAVKGKKKPPGEDGAGSESDQSAIK